MSGCLSFAPEPAHLTGVELYLTVPTVSTFPARIPEKMGMKTSAELMPYGLHRRMID